MKSSLNNRWVHLFRSVRKCFCSLFLSINCSYFLSCVPCFSLSLLWSIQTKKKKNKRDRKKTISSTDVRRERHVMNLLVLLSQQQILLEDTNECCGTQCNRRLSEVSRLVCLLSLSAMKTEANLLEISLQRVVKGRCFSVWNFYPHFKNAPHYLHSILVPVSIPSPVQLFSFFLVGRLFLCHHY